MLDIAVVGAGVMGSLHARVALGLRDATLTSVIDTDVEAGKRLADTVGVDYLEDVDALVGRVDAAILAVPTELHHTIGERLLQAGISLLVEKPIARDTDEALSLERAAAESGATLMVGHVERFNPVVLELEHIVEDPIHVDIARVGRFAPRVGDSVVLDLMVHDLDIACALFGDYSPRISAIGQRVVTSEPDIVTASLEFPGGSTAVVTASRLGQHKIRRIEVTQRESFIAADLLKQTLLIQRATRADQVMEGGYRQESIIEVPYLRHRGEPLFLEQTHFVNCVANGTRPLVTGADGRRVLELALEVKALLT